MTSYVIFFNPLDQPGKFVTRRFVGIDPTADATITDSLEEARKAVPPGFIRIERAIDDHPSVQETWL